MSFIMRRIVGKPVSDVNSRRSRGGPMTTDTLLKNSLANALEF
jgi:hypothetical protein